jgi:alkylation response protein AidB-like acyl-CoA dehydrogenase
MRAMFTMMNNARLNVGLQGVAIAEAATQAGDGLCAMRAHPVAARRRNAAATRSPIVEHPDVRRMLMRMKALTRRCARAGLLRDGGGSTAKHHRGRM